MRTRVFVLLVCCLLFLLGGCSSQKETTTLMIYMIGSDLEAKTGSASLDLEEIAESGIKLSRANVVVCAGGTTQWKDDSVENDEISILELGKNGFTKADHMKNRSMGDQKCLSEFLNYAVKTYDSDRYALILWDHGNGPLLGFGKDILYDNDSLTLLEMKQALSSSPFGKDRKLSWVGFDACLMASAELASIWKDYAEYLVASQEVEPAFGWQYGFLKNFHRQTTEELMTSIAKDYLDSCQEYYKEKEYQNRETTLSCVDLSKQEAFQEALENLFASATKDIETNYNRLAGKRVNTKALGKASTGADYDLVDVGNMAEQLKSTYPEESARLKTALDELIVSNQTNTQDCSGISLYYPFFNKYYYTESWADIYEELGLFPEYLKYLSKYADNWLEEIEPDGESAKPVMTGQDTFSLRLSDTQAESFSGATFTILRHDYDDAYTRIFTSANVKYDEKTKTIHGEFDGNILYLKSGNDYFIPVTEYYETAGNLDYYGIDVTLDNRSSMTWGDPDVDTELDTTTYAKYVLTLDHATGDVAVCSLTERDEEDEEITAGKRKELNADDYSVCYFFDTLHTVLTRNSNGTVRALNQWLDHDMGTWKEFSSDDFSFQYGPLSYGEYSIIFEIQDSYGNRYCSEPSVIDSMSEDSMDASPSDEITEIEMAGNSVDLMEKEGISLRMIREKTPEGVVRLALECDNTTDRTIEVSTYDDPVICNGKYSFTEFELGCHVEPGETSHCSDYTLGGFEQTDAAAYGGLDSLESLEFYLTAEDYITRKELLDRTHYKINLKDPLPIKPVNIIGSYSDDYSMLVYPPEDYSYSYLGAMAEKQTLYETEELKLDLLSFGCLEENSHPMALYRVENMSDETKWVSVRGAAFNDFVYTESLYGTFWELPPHTISYDSIIMTIDEDYLDKSGIKGINSMEIFCRQSDSNLNMYLEYGEVISCPVKLSKQSDVMDDYKSGSKMLFENNGIRIALMDTETDDDGRKVWYLSVENDTDQSFSLALGDVQLKGRTFFHQNDSGFYVDNGKVGAHQHTVATIVSWSDAAKNPVTFRWYFMNDTKSRILSVSEDTVHLE